jgi:hypothetical protein
MTWINLTDMMLSERDKRRQWCLILLARKQEKVELTEEEKRMVVSRG